MSFARQEHDGMRRGKATDERMNGHIGEVSPVNRVTEHTKEVLLLS